MATSTTLTWVPGGGPNVVTQDVKYRKVGASVWTTGVAGLGPTVNSAVITAAFDDNQLYEWQVIDNCSAGGPTPSSTFQAIKFTCPILVLTHTSTSVTVTFPHLGGSIDKYVVKLYDSTGAVSLGSHNKIPPYGVNVADTFTGLTANTTYKVRVEVYAGTKSKVDCPVQNVTTDVTPVCTSPTNLNVIMS